MAEMSTRSGVSARWVALGFRGGPAPIMREVPNVLKVDYPPSWYGAEEDLAGKRRAAKISFEKRQDDYGYIECNCIIGWTGVTRDGAGWRVAGVCLRCETEYRVKLFTERYESDNIKPSLKVEIIMGGRIRRLL